MRDRISAVPGGPGTGVWGTLRSTRNFVLKLASESEFDSEYEFPPLQIRGKNRGSLTDASLGRFPRCVRLQVKELSEGAFEVSFTRG